MDPHRAIHTLNLSRITGVKGAFSNILTYKTKAQLVKEIEEELNYQFSRGVGMPKPQQN
jgi:hypothetical protein